ncbi:MAG: mucoidy inhibitor MuiA family protein [Geminicoccaceae bacterium]
MRAALLLSTAVLALGAGSVPLAAATLPAESRIEQVTVFPDRAEIVRSIEIDLPAGASQLVVTPLPAGLIGDSVRIEGASEGGTVHLGAVDVQRRFSADSAAPRERELEQDIGELERRGRALQDRVTAARVRLDFINALGRSLPQAAGEQVGRGLPDPEIWEKSWKTLGDGAEDALDDIREAEGDLEGVNRQIEARRSELAQIRNGARSLTTTTIGVEADQPARTSLRLHYQVPGAIWRPAYEARMNAAGDGVRLVQRAEVVQTTGEDWTGVQLVLSTARPADTAVMPDLQPWFVDVEEPVEAYRAEPAPLALEMRLEADAPMAAGKAAEPQLAETVAGEFAAEYRVPGLADVAADGASRMLTLTERDLPVTLAVRATPRLLPGAFLFGETVYPGPEPLLPGPLAIYRDGAYVGTSHIAGFLPGETVRVPFGIDDRVSVDYRLETGGRSTEGVFSKDRRVERHYRIDVANRHDTAIPVTIVDQIPVPQDERISVQLLPTTTAVTTTDPGGRRGILEWTEAMAPGATRQIDFGYAVTYPEGVRVEGF